MKNLLLAVTAFLVLGQNAEATSRKSVLAQHSVSPFSRHSSLRPSIRAPKRQVVIYADGDVYGYLEAARPSEKRVSYKLERLTKKELRNLSELVTASREGEVKDNGPVFCLAMPTRSFSYSADNDSVTLQSGSSPCGAVQTNQAPEAKELIEVLNDYMEQLGRKANGLEG